MFEVGGNLITPKTTLDFVKELTNPNSLLFKNLLSAKSFAMRQDADHQEAMALQQIITQNKRLQEDRFRAREWAKAQESAWLQHEKYIQDYRRQERVLLAMLQAVDRVPTPIVNPALFRQLVEALMNLQEAESNLSATKIASQALTVQWKAKRATYAGAAARCVGQPLVLGDMNFDFNPEAVEELRNRLAARPSPVAVLNKVPELKTLVNNKVAARKQEYKTIDAAIDAETKITQEVYNEMGIHTRPQWLDLLVMEGWLREQVQQYPEIVKTIREQSRTSLILYVRGVVQGRINPASLLTAAEELASEKGVNISSEFLDTNTHTNLEVRYEVEQRHWTLECEAQRQIISKTSRALLMHMDQSAQLAELHAIFMALHHQFAPAATDRPKPSLVPTPRLG